MRRSLAALLAAAGLFAAAASVRAEDWRKRELARFYDVGCVAFSPDGRTLVSGMESGDVCFWDVERGRPDLELAGGPSHRLPVTGACFSPQGILVTVGSDGIACISSPGAGVVRHSMGHPLFAVAISPEGHVVAVAGEASVADRCEPRLTLVEIGTGRELARLAWRQGEIKALAWAPRATLLASVGVMEDDEGAAILWDTKAHREVRRFVRSGPPIAAVAFSPDGVALATGDGNGQVRLFSVKDGREIRSLAEPEVDEPIRALAFSPDGRLLVSASRRALRVWNVDGGTLRRTLEEIDGGFLSVAFSPDGRRIAAGSRRSAVHLFEIDR
jgi:WD40 repeat protein